MKRFFSLFLAAALLLSGCLPARQAGSGRTVLAVETFLADITQQVAGDRLMVDSLIPAGLDPHSFEPTPREVARISETDVMVVNGAGFETWLDPVLQNAGGQHLVITASQGLSPRQPKPGEHGPDENDEHAEGDPHFWLDPLLVIRYVENIRDGLSQFDPEGTQDYAKNAAAYIEQLRELDGFIRQQVDQIPVERRMMITNHESFGYFADRYGLRIAGSIIPSASTSAAPSAQQLGDLVKKIRASGAPAVFLETGSNPQLAEQLAAETGIRVVTGLATHSTSEGPAATYLEMMRYNTGLIVDALKSSGS